MISHYDPSEPDDVKAAERLLAEPWMLELLSLNPEYTHWVPGEDYMGKNGHWGSPLSLKTWSEMFSLDDRNEVVNFYFSVGRDSKRCEKCGYYGHGYSPEAIEVRNTLDSTRVERDITLDELQALIESNGRFREPRGSVTELLQALRTGSHKHFFDSLDMQTIVKVRCERLGLPVLCDACLGEAFVYTGEKAHVNLTLWILHPHQGASRGCRIERIEQSELTSVFRYLDEAADRNARRFRKVSAMVNLAAAVREAVECSSGRK